MTQTDPESVAVLRASSTVRVRPVTRGAPKCDVRAVEDALLRVSAMVERHPEIAELDANPLVALPDGAVIVDARVRVEAPAPAPPLVGGR